MTLMKRLANLVNRYFKIFSASQAMIEILQNYRKTVLGTLFTMILSLSMLGFGINLFIEPSTPDDIKINSEKIPLREFYRQKRVEENRLRRMFGARFGAMAEQFAGVINQNTLDQLISRELLNQFSDILGLSGPGNKKLKRELVKQLFPQGYNKRMYQSMLQDVGLSARRFEEEFRSSLRVDQIRALIQDSSLATPTETRGEVVKNYTRFSFNFLEANLDKFEAREYHQATEEELQEHYQSNTSSFTEPAGVSFKYIQFDKDKFKGLIEFTTDDLKSYYSNHQDRYRSETRLKMQHIQIDLDEDSEKRETQKKDAEKLLTRIKEGLSFESAVKNFSSDLATRDSDGITKWLKRGELSDELDQVVWRMTEASEPELVESGQHLHIVKLGGLKSGAVISFSKALSRVKEDYSKELGPAFLGAKAQELYYGWISTETQALSSIAESNQLEVFSSNGLVSSDSIPEKPEIAQLASEILGYPNQNKLLIELQNGPALVSVLERTNARVKPFEEAREEVAKSFYKSKTKEFAKIALSKLAKDVDEKGKKTKNDPSLASRLEQLTDLPSGVRFGKSQGISKSQVKAHAAPFDDPLLMEKLIHLSSKEGVISEVLESNNRLFLFEVVGRTLPSESVIREHLSEYLERSSQLNTNLVLQSLVNSLKAKADISVPAVLR